MRWFISRASSRSSIVYGIFCTRDLKMDPDELEKARRETLRSRIIQTLNISGEWPVSEDILLQAVGGLDMPVQVHDVRRALAYLDRRKLVTIARRGSAPQWEAKLSRHGVDLAEYAIDCEPGIARPQRYW